MIFDAYYHDSYHAITIYVPVVRYDIKDGKAFEVTKEGTRRVPVGYARQRIKAWQEKEAKMLTEGPPTRRQLSLMMIGWTLIAVGLFGLVWMAGMW